MTNELFIVIILFCVFILAITLTLIIYNNRVNKKVKNYINDKKGRPGISIPPLIYILGVLAIVSLIVSSAIYLIPKQKLYEVNYVLYTHPASMTIVLNEEDFDLEKMMESIIYNSEEISNSDSCSVFMKDTENTIVIEYQDGKIVDIQIPNIVIAFNNGSKQTNSSQTSKGYEVNNIEYKEYSVAYNEGRIILNAVLHKLNDGTFQWGPLDSEEYALNVKLFYVDFETQHQEFLLSEETTFTYVLDEDNLKGEKDD